MWIDEESLTGTLDVLDRLTWEGGTVPAGLRDAAITFLLDRQVVAGRSAGTFAPFADECDGVRLFTGERLRTRTATRSVLTLESARLLQRLGGERPDVRLALTRTAAVMRHACFAARHCVIGECAHSSIAYMRDAASDRSGERRKWIEDHLRVLGCHRDGAGRWRRFPFYYTLLALLEVGTPSANAELEYTIPACKRVRVRLTTACEVDRRRAELVRRVLSVHARPPSLPGRTVRPG